MGDALDAASNGTIRYSLCNWGEAAVHLWGETTGATSWRVTSDIYRKMNWYLFKHRLHLTDWFSGFQENPKDSRRQPIPLEPRDVLQTH